MLKINHSQISTLGTLAAATLAFPELTADPAAHALQIGGILLGAGWGSVAPDLDLKIPSVIPTLLTRLVMLPVNPKRGKKITASHRTYSHCLFTVLAILLVYLLVTQLFGVASALAMVVFGYSGGYVLHILADMTTYHGIPLLWPFSQKKYHVLPSILRFATGKSVLEYIYTYTFSGLALVVIVMQVFAK